MMDDKIIIMTIDRNEKQRHTMSYSTQQTKKEEYPSTSTFERNVKIAQQHHDKGLDYCYVYDNIDKSVSSIKKSISMREALFGKYDQDTALSYFRLGSVLVEESSHKRDFFEALIVSRREFRISQKLLRRNNDDTTTTYTIDNSSDDAWFIDRKAFIIDAFIKAQKYDSILDVEGAAASKKYWSQFMQAIRLESAGDRHYKAKEWELAVTQYTLALTLETASYGRNQLDMADLKVKIGDCLYKIGEYESAIDEYSHAKDIYDDEFSVESKATPFSHTSVAIIHSKIAAIYLKLNNFDSALACHSKAYASYEYYFGSGHEICCDELQSIRLVAVKEIEYLRNMERLKVKGEEEKKSSVG